MGRLTKYTTAALLALGATGAIAANPTLISPWESGNAAAECAQIGIYACSYKLDWADAVDENGLPVVDDENGAYEVSCTGPLGENWNTTITISNSTGSVFDWSSSPSAIGAVIVKAGTQANVWTYAPQVWSDTGLYSPLGQNGQPRDVSHTTFCYNYEPEEVYLGEWCSPGYWRQEQHLDSWAATGYSPDALFFDVFGYNPPRSKLGVTTGATQTPTLWQVLQAPQWYEAAAFNAIGDLLSEATS